MEPRGVLRCGHILELEILLHCADNLLRGCYRLPHLRGLDRRKALSPRARQAIARATQLTGHMSELTVTSYRLIVADCALGSGSSS